MIYFIVIYLTGYVVSYLVYKRTFKKQFNKWLVSDRASALVFCFFSWIALIAIFIVNTKIVLSDKGDEPAKW